MEMLEKRIKKLETKSRLLFAVLVLLLFVFGVYVVLMDQRWYRRTLGTEQLIIYHGGVIRAGFGRADMGRNLDSSDSLNITNLTLLDDRGNKRITLKIDETGNGHIQILDEQGRPIWVAP